MIKLLIIFLIIYLGSLILKQFLILGKTVLYFIADRKQLKSIKEFEEKLLGDKKDEVNCPICKDSGYVFDDKTETLIPCSCKSGQEKNA